MGNFKDLTRVDLAVLKKDFLEIPKWQHKLAQYYKRGKFSHFLNNAAKTCIYGLKISENIEIGHVFQSGALFHLSGNLQVASARLKGKLRFMNIRGLVRILVIVNLSLNQTLLTFLLYLKQTWMTQLILAISL